MGWASFVLHYYWWIPFWKFCTSNNPVACKMLTPVTNFTESYQTAVNTARHFLF